MESKALALGKQVKMESKALALGMEVKAEALNSNVSQCKSWSFELQRISM